VGYAHRLNYDGRRLSTKVISLLNYAGKEPTITFVLGLTRRPTSAI
jgi:hypothetical protein